MKIKGGLIIGLVVLCSWFTACATHPPPPVTAPCQPQKAYQGPPGWEEIVKDAESIKSLSALVEITFSQGSAAKVNGLLAYQFPDLLRFEVLSPWGQPSAYLILKDQQLAYFTFGDNRLILASADGPLIKEFLGLELRSAWLFALLNGQGWVAKEKPEILGMDELKTGRKFYLHYAEAGFQESIEWDGVSGEVKEIIFVSPRDRLEVRARSEDFGCSNNIHYPKKVSLSSPSGWQAQMTFTQLQLNLPLEPSLFEIPGPQEGMKVYQLK